MPVVVITPRVCSNLAEVTMVSFHGACGRQDFVARAVPSRRFAGFPSMGRQSTDVHVLQTEQSPRLRVHIVVPGEGPSF